MNKIVIGLFIWLCLPMHSIAQSEKSLFRSLPNWQAVLDEAAKENKNIFVDLYATWCIPCRDMDKYVYSDASVQQTLDSNFLPVKIQMDKTKNDVDSIKSWYADADKIAATFKVKAFPTLLFLSPRGELLRLETGLKEVPKLKDLVKQANDPNEAYYLKLLAYNEGRMPARNFLDLAIRTKKYNNDSLAVVIVNHYKSKWFDRQELSRQLGRELVDMLVHFPETVKEQDRIVRYMYLHPSVLDSLIRKNMTADYLRYFIRRDFTAPIIETADKKGKEPDWHVLEQKIAKRYDAEKAASIAFDDRLVWYYEKQDWENVVKFEIEKVERIGLEKMIKDSKSQINNLVYDIIFKRSKNPAYLLKGAEYMEALLKIDPIRYTWIDTYANVLYKMGRKTEAIDQERKALSLATAGKSKSDQEEYEKVLKLMISDKPTWK